MGKIEYFRINLQKPMPLYFPGESISGLIDFKVIERLKINSLSMSLDGHAKVQW